MSAPSPTVASFWDEPTGSWQHVLHDPATRKGAIVDPVRGFDPQAGALCTRQADRLLAHVEREGIEVEWILDTHPHADHLSAAPYLSERLGARTAIGERVVEVQRLWAAIYNLVDLPCDGRQWDRLLAEGDVLGLGEVAVRVMHSPGHTPASITYVAGNAAFVHDTLMMPDSGTSRADFPGGDARALWRSIQAILALPDDTRLYVGHDYAPGGREARCLATVGEQRRANRHLAGVGEAEFVERRRARDATLPLPRLMLAALQVNIRGGRPPEPEGNGRSYLKIPLGRFESRERG